MFMNKVNEEFFAPRGLKASIKKDKELGIMLGEDPDQPRIAPPGHSPAAVTVAERRLFALQGLVAPLTFEVPPPEQRRNMMGRLTAKGVHRKIQKGRKDAVKAARKQGVAVGDADLALLSSSESSSSSDPESDRPRKQSPKKAAKRERERTKKAGEREKKMAKKAGEKAKDDAKQAAKLSWIVIENLPQQQRHAREYHMGSG